MAHKNVKVRDNYHERLRQIAEANRRSMIKQVEHWIDKESIKVKK